MRDLTRMDTEYPMVAGFRNTAKIHNICWQFRNSQIKLPNKMSNISNLSPGSIDFLVLWKSWNADDPEQ